MVLVYHVMPKRCCCCGLGCGSTFVGFIFLIITIPAIAVTTVASIESRNTQDLCSVIQEMVRNSYSSEINLICGNDKKLALLIVSNMLAFLAAWNGIEAILCVGLMWGANQDAAGWLSAWLMGTTGWATIHTGMVISFIFAFPEPIKIMFLSIGLFIFLLFLGGNVRYPSMSTCLTGNGTEAKTIISHAKNSMTETPEFVEEQKLAFVP